MSGEINVVNRTQTIKVDPVSGSIAIINAGPIGPGGPPGAQGSGPLGPIVQGVQNGPFTLGAGNFQPIPGGGIMKNFALAKAGQIQVIISAYLDTGVGVVGRQAVPNEVALALQLTGANTSQAGSIPERVLRCGGKSPVSSTVSISYVESLVPGTTYCELRYRAQIAGAILSDAVMTIIVIPS